MMHEWTQGAGIDAERLVECAREHERNGRAQDALAAYDRVLADAPPSARTADVLRWKGTLLRETGHTAAAESMYRQSLAIAQQIGYSSGVAHAQNCLAIVSQRRGDSEVARDLYKEAARGAAAAGERRLVGMIEQNLGALATTAGDVADALARYQASLDAFRTACDHDGQVWVLNNLGLLKADIGRFEEAEQALDEALAIARERRNLQMVALVELSRAEALIATGRLQDAEAGCERALRIADERGDRLRRAEALRLRAAIARQRSRLDEAERLVEEAQQLARESEDALLTAELLRELGEVWLRRGDSTRARTAWLEALATFRKLGAAPDAGDVEQRLSRLAA